MSDNRPALDQSQLSQLRALVQRLHRHDWKAVPLSQLVGLARNLRLDGGVTIDLKASAELGQPMVVLRLPPPPTASLAALSRREHQVASLLAQGLSNKQIARRLFLAVGTIKDHVHRILVKTGLPNRAAIAAACKAAPAS